MERVNKLIDQLGFQSVALATHPQREIFRPISRSKATNAFIATIAVSVWLLALTLALEYLRPAGAARVGANRIIGSAVREDALGTNHSVRTTPQPVPRPTHEPGKLDVANQKAPTPSLKTQLAQVVAQDRQTTTFVRLGVPRESTVQSPKSEAVQTAKPPPLESNPATNIQVLSSQYANFSAGLPEVSASPIRASRIGGLKPTENAVEHRAKGGTIDYSLVAPSSFSQHWTKVVSLRALSEGVVVRSLDDGKAYLLTSKGEWRKYTP